MVGVYMLLMVVACVLSFLGILFLISLIVDYGPGSLYKIWWRRYRANAWVKCRDAELVPIKLIARTEDGKFVVCEDCDNTVLCLPIEKIIVPLEKELVVKAAARISDT